MFLILVVVFIIIGNGFDVVVFLVLFLIVMVIL